MLQRLPGCAVTVCDSLGAYADGELDPVEAEVFRAHLDGCPQCQHDLIFTMKVIGMLSWPPTPKAITFTIAKDFNDWLWRWSWRRFRWEVHSLRAEEYTFRTGKYMYGIEPDPPTGRKTPRKSFLWWRGRP